MRVPFVYLEITSISARVAELLQVAHLDILPLLVPIPSLNRHVVASRKHDTRSRMDGKTSNVVGMRLEGGNLLVCVVIEDAQLEVVRASNEPVFARDELDASYRNLSDLERLDQCASFVVVDVDCAIVETGEQPGFRRMKVDTLDAI